MIIMMIIIIIIIIISSISPVVNQPRSRLVQADIFCSGLDFHQKKTWMRRGFWGGVSDRRSGPISAGMLRAARPLL